MNLLEVPSPLDVTEAWWVEVTKKARNSVVFIDDHFCESLHWCGGASRLWSNGCKSIKSFSSFEKCEDRELRAMFLISSAICDTSMQILKDIISSANLNHVTVITAANKFVQSYSQHHGKDEDENFAMTELETKISPWFKNKDHVIEIFSFPLLLLPIAEDVFLMPKFRTIFPVMESTKHYVKQNNKAAGKMVSNLNDVEFDHLPLAFRQEIRHLVGVFHNIFQVMNVREEIYSIGRTSAIIATELDTCVAAKLRRRTAMGKISLLLIDRTMDLAGPMGENKSSLYGKIMTALDKLPSHNIDRSVSLAPLANVHPSCEWTLMPGCFSHPEKECKLFMNQAVKCNAGEADKFISKTITDIVEGVGDPSSGDLLGNIKTIFQSESCIEKHFGLIQQGLGVLAANQPSANKEHKMCMESCRRSILQNCSDKWSAMDELLALLSKKEFNFSLDDVLSIMLYIVSLEGERVVDASMQYQFVNAVSLAILAEKDHISPLLLELANGEVDDLSALNVANRLWNVFVDVTTARHTLKEYRSITSKSSEAEPVLYNNFVARLVKDCITKGHVNDLEYKSSGFKNIIKSGFSLFVNVSKPMPREASMMIIYVVGGITTDEVKEISDIVRDVQPNLRIVVGSSHFTDPTEILTNVVRGNPLMA